MDEIYERMKDDTEIYAEAREKPTNGQIRQFYAGKTVLVTGCTGYIGKCLIEKLLRTCTDIKHIYMFVRPRKQMSVQERMKKYFDNVVFDLLRKQNPRFEEKFTLIQGDLEMPDLGLSPEDRQLIIENTDLIIHNGAMVQFHMKISRALRVNVISTKKLLELGSECHHLKAFMYVSTGYSQLNNKYIEERLYPPPADLKMVEDIIRADTENASGVSEAALEQLTGDCPNIYIFTKATAEGIVDDYAKKARFSCGVFRPTIVVSMAREPLVGWCGNFNGPVFLALAAHLGLLHTICIKPNTIFDIIPVDLTCNGLLAAVWDLADYKKPQKCYYYHYSSSELNPTSLPKLRDLSLKTMYEYPSKRTVWYPFILIVPSSYVFYMLHIIVHIIPCILMDLFLLLRGKSAIGVPALIQNNKALHLFMDFINGSWVLQMDQMKTIWERMNAIDHQEFYCDIRDLCWQDYAYFYWRGFIRYILQEKEDVLPIARRRLRMLKIVHFTIVTFLVLLFVYFVSGILGF